MPRTPIGPRVSGNIQFPWLGGTPAAVSDEVRKLVSEYSAAIHARKGKAVKVDAGAGPSKPRDDRPGMFTPPTFSLLTLSPQANSEIDDMNVDSSP